MKKTGQKKPPKSRANSPRSPKKVLSRLKNRRKKPDLIKSALSAWSGFHGLVRRQFLKLPLPARIRPVIARHWFILAVVIAFVAFGFYIFTGLPLPTKLASSPFPASTLIYDRRGRLLYEIYADKNRVPVSVADLPEYLKEATVASEDKDFYRHHGFDFRGIFRAAYNTVFRRSLQGGSTITQQLVKTALLTPERTVRRKIREAVLSWATEIIYSKDQILEMYLNQVPYGGTAWGIEAAAQTYFGKPARDLTLAEAALLAGLPASPTRFSPFGAHPELAKSRQERVLQAMADEGYITPEEMDQAKNDKLLFSPAVIEIKAPHFVLWVKELLVEKYGEAAVEQGGFRVTTTLDLDLQDFAQTAVASQVAKLQKQKVGNGAALVTQPATGEILAMVGSHDYFDKEGDGNVNVTLRPRQPGSSIKPLNYAQAMEKKLITPATLVIDMPTCFTVTGQKAYCPVNYDGGYRGPVQVRFALGNSLNIPAVKVLALNGIEDFVSFGREAGLSTWGDPKNYGLSLTLGGGEVTMHDMATAFSAFANLGLKKNLYAIQKIEDAAGRLVFEQEEADGSRVLSMETAYLISHILLDNNARAGTFGSGSYLVVRNHPEVSVKTGTTNDYRDAWTIGYTPSRLVAVWMGNNDNTPMSAAVAGVTAAAPVWNQIMTEALKDQKQEWLSKPEGIVGAQVCALSGRSPNPATPCDTRFEYFIEGTIPADIETPRQFIEIDKTTGSLANDKTPPENRELQEHTLLFDLLNLPYCLDCPSATQSAVVRYPLAITATNQ